MIRNKVSQMFHHKLSMFIETMTICMYIFDRIKDKNFVGILYHYFTNISQ